MDANTERLANIPVTGSSFDFADLFRAEYARIAGVIARIIGDPARAEDLAVDAFCRLWRRPQAQAANAGGWLHRAAVRIALDELRRRRRREKYEKLFSIFRAGATEEQRHFDAAKQRQVREILSRMKPRDAQLLLLKGEGFSYQEIAAALELSPASVGTLLRRAQESFRERYLKRYGQQD